MRRFLLLWLFVSLAAFGADEPWQQWMSEARFKTLCVELSHNVDLFEKIWFQAPDTVFYGGTSRDFLWFVRGELAKATSQADLERRVEALRSRPIEAKEFIVGSSDIDAITAKSLYGIEYDKDLVTKIEAINPKWFHPGTPSFEQEKRQGYIPVEKIRLGLHGFGKLEGVEQGNGVHEIYTGRPTFHPDPAIVETDFYKKHENHPLLLALRYLRQVAIAYFRLHGKEYPKKEELLSLMDEESKRRLRAVLEGIEKNPTSLDEFLAKDSFKRRLNRTLQKAFRSYTNPTAAKLLFEEFGIDRLLEVYGDKIASYHTLMYRKYRNPGDIERHREELGIAPNEYLTTAEEHFKANGIALEKTPEGETVAPFFHGTPSMEAYRNIVFQGNVASEVGLAGDGVYVVDPRSKEFAATWRGKAHVVKLRLDPKAVIVDISKGPGKEAFEKFKAGRWKWYFDGRPVIEPRKSDESAFADFVGADLVKYDYGKTQAYVIKNGTPILGQEGISIPLMTIEQARRDLAAKHYSVERFTELVSFDKGLFSRWPYLLGGMDEKDAMRLVLGLAEKGELRQMVAKDLVANPVWRRHPAEREATIKKIIETAEALVDVQPFVDGLLQLPETLQPKIARSLLARDEAVGQQTALKLRDVPWSEAMWEAMLPYLEHGQYRCLLWQHLSSKTGAPKTFKLGSLRERALVAAKLYAGFLDDLSKPLPRQATEIDKTLARLFGLTLDELHAGMALVQDRDGKPMTYETYLAVSKQLGFKESEIGSLNVFSRAHILGRLARDGHPVSTAALEALEKELVAHEPILPRLIINQMKALLALPLPSATEYVRLHLEALKLDLSDQAQVLGAVYEVAPQLFAESDWKRSFDDLSERALRQMDTLRRRDFEEHPFSKKHMVEAIAALLYVPERFQQLGAAELLKRTPEDQNSPRGLDGALTLEAIAGMKTWSKSVWHPLMDAVFHGKYTSDMLWPIFREMPFQTDIPKAPATLSLWERAYRGAEAWKHAKFLDRDIHVYWDGLLGALREYYGYDDAQFKAAQPFAVSAYDFDKPASLADYETAKRVLGLTVEDLSVMGPEAEASQLRALVKADPNFEPRESLEISYKRLRREFLTKLRNARGVVRTQGKYDLTREALTDLSELPTDVWMADCLAWLQDANQLEMKQYLDVLNRKALKGRGSVSSADLAGAAYLIRHYHQPLEHPADGLFVATLADSPWPPEFLARVPELIESFRWVPHNLSPRYRMMTAFFQVLGAQPEWPPAVEKKVDEFLRQPESEMSGVFREWLVRVKAAQTSHSPEAKCLDAMRGVN